MSEVGIWIGLVGWVGEEGSMEFGTGGCGLQASGLGADGGDGWGWAPVRFRAGGGGCTVGCGCAVGCGGGCCGTNDGCGLLEAAAAATEKCLGEPGGSWWELTGLYTGVSGGPWLDSKDPGREFCSCCGFGKIGGRA